MTALYGVLAILARVIDYANSRGCRFLSFISICDVVIINKLRCVSTITMCKRYSLLGEQLAYLWCKFEKLAVLLIVLISKVNDKNSWYILVSFVVGGSSHGIPETHQAQAMMKHISDKHKYTQITHKIRVTHAQSDYNRNSMKTEQSVR